MTTVTRVGLGAPAVRQGPGGALGPLRTARSRAQRTRRARCTSARWGRVGVELQRIGERPPTTCTPPHGARSGATLGTGTPASRRSSSACVARTESYCLPESIAARVSAARRTRNPASVEQTAGDPRDLRAFSHAQSSQKRLRCLGHFPRVLGVLLIEKPREKGPDQKNGQVAAPFRSIKTALFRCRSTRRRAPAVGVHASRVIAFDCGSGGNHAVSCHRATGAQPVRARFPRPARRATRARVGHFLTDRGGAS